MTGAGAWRGKVADGDEQASVQWPGLTLTLTSLSLSSPHLLISHFSLSLSYLTGLYRHSLPGLQDGDVTVMMDGVGETTVENGLSS